MFIGIRSDRGFFHHINCYVIFEAAGEGKRYAVIGFDCYRCGVGDVELGTLQLFWVIYLNMAPAGAVLV